MSLSYITNSIHLNSVRKIVTESLKPVCLTVQEEPAIISFQNSSVMFAVLGLEEKLGWGKKYID